MSNSGPGAALGADYELDLFGRPVERWREHWKGMPEFVQEDLTPHRTLSVHCASDADYEDFERRFGHIYHGKWIWFPARGYARWRDYRYVTKEPVLPKYPVYVISKGRWGSPLTANALERLMVPHFVVVEPQEREKYATTLGSDRLLVTPFSNLGLGSIPARNFVWEHAAASGAERHWILDDNIDGFYRLNRNSKIQTTCGVMFRAAEDFVDRYENIAISGFQYESFAMRRAKLPPFVANTRVYSCILIKNDIPYRWRGRYNEDTDLSIRALKDGWCTVLFNAFLANKVATMTMSGGNTDELYAQTDDFDGRLAMAESLMEQHPDIVKVTRKWGRWQHHVDYSAFHSNELVLKPGVTVEEGPNNYGMALKRLDKEGSSKR